MTSNQKRRKTPQHWCISPREVKQLVPSGATEDRGSLGSVCSARTANSSSSDPGGTPQPHAVLQRHTRPSSGQIQTMFSTQWDLEDGVVGGWVSVSHFTEQLMEKTSTVEMEVKETERTKRRSTAQIKASHLISSSVCWVVHPPWPPSSTTKGWSSSNYQLHLK